MKYIFGTAPSELDSEKCTLFHCQVRWGRCLYTRMLVKKDKLEVFIEKTMEKVRKVRSLADTGSIVVFLLRQNNKT